ncbi:hypothetical protein SOVF_200840 [Spinacia oleracea]|uniref:Gustatory receptor n=1 Tax=Spinacia oleracea TaxID=3562 RepID=A0A9R0JE83_SPIOL|nr:uncharacterized protein LOC110805022 [Spinacia oleracea]XP_021866309.2 uncharacterized protein LOC110805022 [Spinacia oleracea]XP_021866310.2 uncharacterized protein LOC110805022 [Spinacia oleracea]KNA04308.1 hypothetical protein SOVF_200840 [Spinacia oleracea]
MAVSLPPSHYSPLEEQWYNPDSAQTETLILPLKHSLRRLKTFLRFLGFIHDSRFSLSLSSFSFLLFGIAAPSLIIVFFYCGSGSASASACRKYHIKGFELETLFFQATAAAVSLLCFSLNFRKYGLRVFLFVDNYQQNVDRFQFEYIPKIDNFFRSLAVWVLPCVILKTAREIVRVIYVHNDSLVQSMMVVFVLLVSWTYTATVYLTGSALFSLVCNLQVIHFEKYKNLLDRNLDVLVYIEEHSRLTFNLSKISHRFRIFLILEFLIVTASQIVTLLETTGNNGTINFINAADFAISSIVQVVGIIICLHAAAKISHRAQSLASFASRWHALLTCRSNETLGASENGGNLNVTGSAVAAMNYPESDMDSVDYILPPINEEMNSNVSSYLKRQAFVMYMQSNPGGVTIFGWTVNRAFMDTIFCVELTVVTFVLGKTLTFTTNNT